MKIFEFRNLTRAKKDLLWIAWWRLLPLIPQAQLYSDKVTALIEIEMKHRDIPGIQLAVISHDGFDFPYNAYALGWPVAIRKKHPAVATIGGGRAFILVYPADDLSIILFTNLTGCSPGEIAEKVAAIYLDGR